MAEAAVETNTLFQEFMTKSSFGFFLTGILLLVAFHVQSQDYAETALLFGRTKPAGSARIQGLGGAQTALGGDYSSGYSNPAGLGMFNRSEFTFSLGYAASNTNSNFNGVSTDGSRSVINIPGISYTHYLPKEKGAFLGGAFSVSLTRTNDFNRSMNYSGPNSDNSIVDYFIDQAFGKTTDQFDDPADKYNTPTGLAYFNYLIGPRSSLDPAEPDDEYFTDVGYPELQKEEIETKGSSNQWNFSYGANFSDKFFLGAGFGITSLKHKVQKTFTELFNNPDTIQNLILNENFDIQGTGINATIGTIVRPIEYVQIGLSYRTPTLIGLTENYRASMSTHWNNFDYYGDGSKILRDNTNSPISTDDVIAEYDLVIPSKLNTGVTFISKLGFISADIEFTNPGKSKYKSSIDGISFSSENSTIKAIYDATVNYRVGAEYRLKIFRIRAGYGMLSNTYRSDINVDNKIQTISGGFGIRKKSYYADLAVISNHSKSLYQPYTFFDGSGPVVARKDRQLNVMVTIGFTF
jgi:hypothetical protein